jgi:hypothetical protein
MATMAALPKVGDIVEIDNLGSIHYATNRSKRMRALGYDEPFANNAKVKMWVEKVGEHALDAETEGGFYFPKIVKKVEDFLALFATYPNKWRVVEYTDHITTTVHGTSQYRTFDLRNLDHEDDDESYGLYGVNEKYLLPSHRHSLRSARDMGRLPKWATKGTKGTKGTMGTMGSMSMPYGDKTAVATMALSGQASKLLAKAKSGFKGAKSTMSDRYWKDADTNIGDNLSRQHSNWADVHKQHAVEWAAALDNLTKDLKAADAKLKKARALPEDDPKREKKAEQAKSAVEKVVRKMDRWLDEHDSSPYQKAKQMFEVFKLGGTDAATKLAKVEKAADKAVADLANTYAQKTDKAVEVAQKAIVAAVKAAIAAGWAAEGLADRNVYA